MGGATCYLFNECVLFIQKELKGIWSASYTSNDLTSLLRKQHGRNQKKKLGTLNETRSFDCQRKLVQLLNKKDASLLMTRLKSRQWSRQNLPFAFTRQLHNGPGKCDGCPGVVVNTTTQNKIYWVLISVLTRTAFINDTRHRTMHIRRRFRGEESSA